MKKTVRQLGKVVGGGGTDGIGCSLQTCLGSLWVCGCMGLKRRTVVGGLVVLLVAVVGCVVPTAAECNALFYGGGMSADLRPLVGYVAVHAHHAHTLHTYIYTPHTQAHTHPIHTYAYIQLQTSHHIHTSTRYPTQTPTQLTVAVVSCCCCCVLLLRPAGADCW